jgi:hypothetical protein
VEDALAKSKILEAEAKIMAEENRIMLTNLATISDLVQGLGLRRSKR